MRGQGGGVVLANKEEKAKNGVRRRDTVYRPEIPRVRVSGRNDPRGELASRGRCVGQNARGFTLTCIPGAPGSTPESRIAMMTPRPSYSGYLVRNWVTPVSFLGSRPQIGKLQSMMSAMFRVPLPLWLQENHPRCFLCTAVALYINRRTSSAPACAPVGAVECASFEVRLTADGTAVSDDYAALVLHWFNYCTDIS